MLLVFQSVFILVTFGFMFFVGIVFVSTLEAEGGIYQSFAQVGKWLDPTYTQYNLLLMSFAVLIVPLITFCYVVSMREEKRNRLKKDFSEAEWESCKSSIDLQLRRNFRFSNYVGSMTALTVIVILGSSILLLLKPMPISAEGASGLDYGKGANFLLLGTYMQLYMDGENYTRQLITSLTAFQFGFLGAYIYFIGHLVRSYFTLDLTPNTFVISSVRMVTGAILALVLSFSLYGGDSPLPEYFVPMISFFLGFFPSRAILLLEKLSIKLLNLQPEKYPSLPLSRLPGMSFNHEIRLNREGFDNLENLAHANTIDLALRTGFGSRQLNVWINQAKLMGHLGDDYSQFVQQTGIQTTDELERFLQHPDDSQSPAIDRLTQNMDARLAAKIRIISTLLMEGNALCPKR